jgi:hypothetical protein
LIAGPASFHISAVSIHSIVGFCEQLFGIKRVSERPSHAALYKVFRRDCIYTLRFECDGFDFDHELVGKLIACLKHRFAQLRERHPAVPVAVVQAQRPAAESA